MNSRPGEGLQQPPVGRLVGVRRGRSRGGPRSRAGSGRCPGTRRAAAAGSAGGAAARTSGCVATRCRASTSRSWNSTRAVGGASAGAVEHPAPEDRADEAHPMVARAAGGSTRPRRGPPARGRADRRAPRRRRAPSSSPCCPCGRATRGCVMPFDDARARRAGRSARRAGPPRPAAPATISTCLSSGGGLDLGGRGEQTEQPLGRRRERERWRRVDARLDEVPVLVEADRDASERLAERRTRRTRSSWTSSDAAVDRARPAGRGRRAAARAGRPSARRRRGCSRARRARRSRAAGRRRPGTR